MNSVCKKCFNVIDVFMQMCPLEGLCESAPQAIQGSQEWPSSTCVECGRPWGAGLMQKCDLTNGGYCNHHIPKALAQYIDELREIITLNGSTAQ